MFEPPILDQLMGVGALLLGFAGLCRHIKLQRGAQGRRETKRARICVYVYPKATITHSNVVERTNGKKFAIIFGKSLKVSPTITNRL